MSRRRRRRHGAELGAAYGDRDAAAAGLARVAGAQPGIVLTREGEDVPLDPDITIDLAAEGAKFEDGRAKFHTRQADPMRPFKATVAEHGTGSQFSEGLHTATAIRMPQSVTGPLAPAHKFTREQVLDHVLKNTPSDSALRSLRSPEELGAAMGIADALRPLDAGQRQSVLKQIEERYAEGVTDALFHTPEGRRLSSLQRERIERALGSAAASYKGDFSADDVAAILSAEDQVLKELQDLTREPKLGRVTESAMHKLFEAWKDHKIISPAGPKTVVAEELQRVADIGDILNRNIGAAGVFLLQHDWAGAFSKAADYEGGEVHLPYTMTVIECRINGRRMAVLLIGGTHIHAPLVLPHFETSNGRWVWLGNGDLTPDFKLNREQRNGIFVGMDDLVDSILAQARAVFIALEAEVATADVIRAPYKLNQKRERAGKLPLFDYHVVSLAARKRYAPRLPEPGDQPTEHHKRRLHFVRGHWRHYTNTKVFIKWHMRGDPDLGFIDKEYRL